GLTVVDLGICPTPLMYFSLFHWGLEGGIQVTGSHNPADYNGFKVCLGQEALHGEQIQELRRRVESGRVRSGAGATESRPVVAPRGRIVWGDELLVIYGRDVLARNPGATIVSEVKCSQRLYDDLSRHGGHTIMWKAGHSLLKAKMRETGALLGGEMSGHIFFKEKYFGYDDAIYAGARLLDIVARTGKRVDQLLADLPPSHTTPEIRVDCPDDLKFAVAERVRDRFRAAGREIIDVDGVRVRFPHGWGLVRASNTQPVLVLRFEADTPEQLAESRRVVAP